MVPYLQRYDLRSQHCLLLGVRTELSQPPLKAHIIGEGRRGGEALRTERLRLGQLRGKGVCNGGGASICFLWFSFEEHPQHCACVGALVKGRWCGA